MGYTKTNKPKQRNGWYILGLTPSVTKLTIYLLLMQIEEGKE